MPMETSPICLITDILIGRKLKSFSVFRIHGSGLLDFALKKELQADAKIRGFFEKNDSKKVPYSSIWLYKEFELFGQK